VLVSLIPVAPGTTLSMTLRIVGAEPPPLTSRMTLEDMNFPKACHSIDTRKTAGQTLRANEMRPMSIGTMYETGTHQQEQL
jgi:hypothetical protein